MWDGWGHGSGISIGVCLVYMAHIGYCACLLKSHNRKRSSNDNQGDIESGGHAATVVRPVGNYPREQRMFEMVTLLIFTFGISASLNVVIARGENRMQSCDPSDTQCLMSATRRSANAIGLQATAGWVLSVPLFRKVSHLFFSHFICTITMITYVALQSCGYLAGDQPSDADGRPRYSTLQCTYRPSHQYLTAGTLTLRLLICFAFAAFIHRGFHLRARHDFWWLRESLKAEELHSAEMQKSHSRHVAELENAHKKRQEIVTSLFHVVHAPIHNLIRLASVIHDWLDTDAAADIVLPSDSAPSPSNGRVHLPQRASQRKPVHTRNLFRPSRQPTWRGYGDTGGATVEATGNRWRAKARDVDELKVGPFIPCQNLCRRCMFVVHRPGMQARPALPTRHETI